MSSVGRIDDLLREKDAKIAALESQKESQQEQIILLREEIGSTDIKHKEEIYWIRLEMDNLRRENEALEDRVQQVYRDIREEEVFPELEAPDEYDTAYVKGLQAQVDKYIRTLGILDHQIVMVKSSCDEVVKSLKEEIGDVMEEKCRVEMDLLNQLTVLDSEKRELEITYDQHMKLKNEQIDDLRKMVAKDSRSVVSGVEDREEELLNEINELRESKKILEDELEAERADADDAIARLEDANADLEQKVDSMTSDLEVMREGAATADTISLKEEIENLKELIDNLKQVIDNVTEEKQRMETNLLNRLAVLDSEKRELEIAYDQLKNEQIADLKTLAAKDSSEISCVQDRGEELLNEINELKESKKILEDELEAERADADDTIARLEGANADLVKKIDSMKSDLEVMREGVATADAISLKEEIINVMKEKQRMETNLLSQLAVLESEKRELEIAYDQQMKLKNEDIADLKTMAAKDSSEVSFVKGREEELLNEINELKESKKKLEDELTAERANADDTIARLEDANADLEQKIDSMKRDLEVMREGAAMADTICLKEEIENLKELIENLKEEIENLKEEIDNVTEEKLQMETNLLDRLTVLDNEKRELEIAYDQQTKLKNEQNADLKNMAAKDSSEVSCVQDREEKLLNEINELKESKKTLEEEFETERADADDTIARLEDAKADLEQKIQTMNSDLEVMREGAATVEAIDVLDALTRDRQETLANLDRVAMIWERADDSIHSLEDIMDELRNKDETNDLGDRERLLSPVEAAALVHGQIKVSLLLVELKLRNQLNSLQNDKLRMGHGGIPTEKDANIAERMQEIQKEALSMLDMAEKSLTDQIKQIEEAERGETKKMEETLQEKTEEIKMLQAQHTSLETEISELRRKEEKERKQHTDEKAEENGSAEIAVSKAVLERLQAEVLSVVERVKEKNDRISKLKTMIEEYRVREATLKKELRRIMKGGIREPDEMETSNGNERRQTRRNL